MDIEQENKRLIKSFVEANSLVINNNVSIKETKINQELLRKIIIEKKKLNNKSS